MHNKSLSALVTLALTVTICVTGQAANMPVTDEATQAGVEATHEQIRQLRDAMIKAINDNNVDALAELVHKDVVLTAQDGEKLATIRSREGVRDYVTRLLTGPDAGVKQITIKPTVDELTILHGDDTGVAYGHSTDHYVLADDSEFDLPTRWSATIVKDDDTWQIASLHVSSNLFDNPVLDAISKYAMLAAICTGLLGLVVGFVIARLLKKQPANSTAP